MTPFFFGTGPRRLFGIYTPGLSGAGVAPAVVICQPWGQEYLRAHRSIRQLATQLTRAGFHVLRFDYFGTGDSAGDMTDGEPAGWQDDIETAIEELKETSGATRVGLLGLRLGATLAAGVAARRRDDIDFLVLWDPVVAGGDYLRELAPGLSSPNPADGLREIYGYPLTERMEKALESLDLHRLLPALPRRTLAIVTAALPAHEALRAKVHLEALTAEPVWRKGDGMSVRPIPVNVLQRIVEWLG